MIENTKLKMLEEENAKLKEQIQFYHDYDKLTGLYNKSTFYKKTEQRLEDSRDKQFYIVCIDIERFKVINELFGREGGDKLLRFISQELMEQFPKEDAVLARMANDLFAICTNTRSMEEIERIIVDIFSRSPLDTTVTPAIGFCAVADLQQPVSRMCDWAIIALKSIKGNFLGHSAVYDSSQRNVLLEEQELQTDMKSALQNDEFVIYLQPKCDMLSDKIIGAEALVRWKHPQKGLIAPGYFIPAFERNGFIKELDVYVWEATARWIRSWIDRGHKPIPVSVNISRVDMYGMDLCGILENLLRKYRLEPRLLELEITEGAYSYDSNKIIETIGRLTDYGFTVLMDDFGSGYSSLNMLNEVNVDILKIDMRFLQRDNQKSKDILKSVVHMSKWLNLPVIAEGVESEKQMEYLLGIGCTCGQGYYFYRPMEVCDFEKILLKGDLVDYTGEQKLCAEQELLLDFHDLFHKDYMSDRMLGHVLGAIALYSYDGTHLTVLRATEEYYKLLGRAINNYSEGEKIDVLSFVLPEDYAVVKKALEESWNDSSESGTEVHMRILRDEHIAWMQARFFFLADKGKERIFYSTVTDRTEQMETIERLRISEEQFWLAMEATNMVLFEVDMETREANYSEYARKAFDLDATVANAPEGFIQQGTVCEESIEDFREVYHAIYRGESKASSIIHARMMDGSTCWNRITLIAVKDKKDKTVKAVGMVETVCSDPEPTKEIQGQLYLQRQKRKERASNVSLSS